VADVRDSWARVLPRRPRRRDRALFVGHSDATTGPDRIPGRPDQTQAHQQQQARHDSDRPTPSRRRLSGWITATPVQHTLPVPHQPPSFALGKFSTKGAPASRTDDSSFCARAHRAGAWASRITTAPRTDTPSSPYFIVETPLPQPARHIPGICDHFYFRVSVW